MARLRPLWESRAPVSGNEVDLLLGTSRPWTVAIGQLLPVGVMAWIVPYPVVWLVFLMVFSAISGAITSQAAAHSRRLWLRFDWSRDEIRRRVERAYWRYNACSLGVLLLAFLALAVWYALESAVLVSGVALLVLGSVDCSYLGLMITRSLGWFESALCILTLTALTLAALAIARGNIPLAVELEVLLAGLAMVYRTLARARWTRLDWMLCRTA
jgi:hypothetical protein